jgi:epoxyqueuosine reductase
MLDSRTVKEYATKCGADVVGVASMDRWEGAPRQMDPRYIAPGAKAMVVMGFRILRGCLRGIEEGTFYIAYSGMGYAGINHVLQPMVLWSFCRMLEDEGYEAVPIPNNFPWNNTDVSGNDPARTGQMRPEWSRPVSPDRPAPDVFVHMRIAAFCAGLGEISYSKLFLTPQFGPRQRLAAVLTNAPIEPDPLFDGGLCDRCMACVGECSGQAISSTETVKVRVAGRELEWGKIDYEKCSRAFCGGSSETNPFMVTSEDEQGFTQPVGRAQNYKVAPTYDYGRAIEGASGCMRACMVHLEEQGKLTNKFREPFRTGKPWRLTR